MYCMTIFRHLFWIYWFKKIIETNSCVLCKWIPIRFLSIASNKWQKICFRTLRTIKAKCGETWLLAIAARDITQNTYRHWRGQPFWGMRILSDLSSSSDTCEWSSGCSPQTSWSAGLARVSTPLMTSHPFAMAWQQSESYSPPCTTTKVLSMSWEWGKLYHCETYWQIRVWTLRTV